MTKEIVREVYVTDKFRENRDINIQMRRRFNLEYVSTYSDRLSNTFYNIYHISDATVVLADNPLENDPPKYCIEIYGRQDAILEVISTIENSLEIKLKEAKQ